MSVSEAEKIDFAGHHSKSDVVTLGMVEEREWNGSEEMLVELEAKIQNYFSFIVDGQFARMYPAYVGKADRNEIVFCNDHRSTNELVH